MNSNNSTKENSPTITIAISTIAENFDTFINNFRFSSCLDADEVIIIIQGRVDKSKINKLNKNFIVVLDDGIGISRSRNIGISYASSDYIWFMDDDISLNHDAIQTVKKYMQQYKADIYTIRTLCLNTGDPYKVYPNKDKLTRCNIIGISSVEIIASRQLLINSKVTFNESLGLGTKYPSCEENIFLLDIFDLGVCLIHIPEYLQKHPPVNYRNDFIDKNTLFAKGIFCKRYNGIMGFLLMLYWMVRSLWSGSPIRNSINLIYGYKSSKKILA